MALFGVETWRANADPFARFFGLFARFAPFAVERGDARRPSVRCRPAARRRRRPLRPPAFVLLALATVSFDGIAETPFWESIVGEAMGLLYRAGIVEVIGYTAASSS